VYDLKSRGVKDFRLAVDRLKYAVRDPLEGSVGTNTVFRARFYPISSTPTPVIYSTSGSVDPSGYELDTETGTVVFDSAPTAQPTMTYKWSNMTDTEVVDILVLAFQDMESRWPRKFKLVDSDSSEVLYPSEATEVNVVDTDGNDPTCGTATFSTSTVERDMLMKCARYSNLAAKMDMAAEQYFMFREDRGVTVDKTKIPANLDLALKRADADVKRAVRAAQSKYYTSGAHLGEAQKSPGTQDYFTDYEWQTGSRDDDYRTTYAGSS